MQRQLPVLHAHDDAVSGFRRDLQTIGQTAAIDDQGVIAGARERRGNILEDANASMGYLTELAMKRRGRADHFAAECLPEGLVAQTDTENWELSSRRLDELQANAGLVRRAGAWRQDDALGLIATASAAVSASLRFTTIWAPSSPKKWYRLYVKLS